MTAAHFAFYRTLYSQSAASLTVSMVAGAVRAADRAAVLTLLSKGDHLSADRILLDRPGDNSVLFLKPNFQDAAESLPLVNEIAATGIYRAVVLIGIYAAGNAREILETYTNISAVITGEPEGVVPELLSELSSVENLESFPVMNGVMSRTAQGIIDRSAGNLLGALDLIDPARDIEMKETSQLANVESGRGCIATCSFCHVPAVEKRIGAPRRRARSVDSVIRDIQHLADMGKRYIVFNDPIFWGGSHDDGRVAEIAHRISMLSPKVQFMVYLRMSPFPSEELLSGLADAGLIRVFIGVETSSAETLKVYRKGSMGLGYGGVSNLLERYGVSHHIGFLVFNPFSTSSQVAEDIDFLYENDQLHRIGVVLERSRLVPGTSLVTRAEEAGLWNGRRHARSVDAAYSWKFQSPEVGRLNRHLNQVLAHQYQGRGRYLEYYHTSTELLRFMWRRSVSAEEYSATLQWWDELGRAKAELAEILYGFYRRSLDRAMSSVDELALDSGDTRFLDQLSALEKRTEVAASVVSHRIRSAGYPELTSSLFTSREGY